MQKLIQVLRLERNVYREKMLTYFRIVLGGYLFFKYYFLYSYSVQFLSSEASSTKLDIFEGHLWFPNLLLLFNSPLTIKIFILLLILASVVLMTGRWQRLPSLLLCYGGICIEQKNILLNSPVLPMMNWILLCLAVMPSEDQRNGRLDSRFYWSAWFLFTLGYSYSGIVKCYSPSWADGSAIYKVLTSSIARNNFFANFIILYTPKTVWRLLTYFVLAIEVLNFPLGLFPSTRKWIWIFTFFLHVGILVLMDLTEISVGMLVVHMFLINQNWSWKKSNIVGAIENSY